MTNGKIFFDETRRILFAAVIALLVALVIILIASKNPLETFQTFIGGPLSSKRTVGNWIDDSAKLALAGLAFSLVFQARQFALGVQGQVYAGGTVAADRATSAASIRAAASGAAAAAAPVPVRGLRTVADDRRAALRERGERVEAGRGLRLAGAHPPPLGAQVLSDRLGSVAVDAAAHLVENRQRRGVGRLAHEAAKGLVDGEHVGRDVGAADERNAVCRWPSERNAPISAAAASGPAGQVTARRSPTRPATDRQSARRSSKGTKRRGTARVFASPSSM